MTMPRQKVLCIDDEESPRESLRYILKDRYDVVTASSGCGGLEALRAQGPFDAVLLDMKMPDLTGLEVLEQIMKSSPAPPVVMVTAIMDPKPAVQAMKMGAADYLSKPFDVDEIRLVVERVIRERSQKKTPAPSPSSVSDNILGDGPAMQRVFNLIERLKDAETTVLIQGETGTGKELVARALHFHSLRKTGPFVPVHCAAIPNDLLESELFGHEKGSFTGALARRIGMFEAADGGTLFLDEIGEMPIGTQSKLLRAIQEREIRRVGSQETIRINVRLVCATNRDLEGFLNAEHQPHGEQGMAAEGEEVVVGGDGVQPKEFRPQGSELDFRGIAGGDELGAGLQPCIGCGQGVTIHLPVGGQGQ